MKHILGIICSPRKLGNCEITVKAISRQIPIPHELSLLRLSDFQIEPCRGCYSCLFKKGECVIEDDLNGILEAIKKADALIIAVPTYFLGPNASLKRFLDRGFTVFARMEEFWGKPALGVGIAGIQGREGYTLLGIESFLKIMMADIKGCAILYGALPGEVFLNPGNESLVSALAASLFGKSIDADGPDCPVCGGRTFRFMDHTTLKCMICSNSGTLQFKDGRPVCDIRKGEHEMFTSRESAISHREWLLGMKEKFLKQKNTLKEITLSYLKDGSWIAPGDSRK
ncbi:MAG: flavodoxin family protein [Thermodesulfobacteriota bacterium]